MSAGSPASLEILATGLKLGVNCVAFMVTSEVALKERKEQCDFTKGMRGWRLDSEA